MTRSLDTYDNIAIAELVLYTFFLAGGIYLCIKHGFINNHGWRYLVILSLARLIGSGMRLGTISDPSNTDLYVGWLTLTNLGLSPLILVIIGLCSRLFDSLKRQGNPTVNYFQRFIEILMLVALILIIVGGTQADYTLGASGAPKISYTSISKAGIALMIVVLVLLSAEFLLLLLKQGLVAQGEHRIFIAVGLSLPFVWVRLIYSCVIIFGGVTSSVWLSLGAGVIMEIIVVIICEAVGFSLGKAPEMPKEDTDQEMQSQKRGGLFRRN